MNKVAAVPQQRQVEKPVNKAGRPKSMEKRAQILKAASELFLQKGITNTSMDLVAQRSGVSKQTVYSHFRNKDALYNAVIDMKCEQYQFDAAHLDHACEDLYQCLCQVGQQFIRLLHDEQVIAMYRVVIGEAISNPHVAELFYQAGPQRTVDAVAQFLQHRKELALDKQQAMQTSVDFFNLLKSDFHMRSMLGLPFAMDEQQQQQTVQRVVNQLLKVLPGRD